MTQRLRARKSRMWLATLKVCGSILSQYKKMYSYLIGTLAPVFRLTRRSEGKRQWYQLLFFDSPEKMKAKDVPRGWYMIYHEVTMYALTQVQFRS